MSVIAIGDEELLDYVVEKDFEDTVARIILSAVASYEKGVGKVRLTKLLLGKDPGSVITGDPALLDHFGRLRMLDRDQVMDFMESLIRLGHMDVTDPDFPRMEVTKRGEKARRSSEPIPSQIPWPLPPKEVPIPEDMELYDRLREERNRIAREEGLPPYCVASNLSLVEMINRGINEGSEIPSIPGMGEARASRYGEQLLKVMGAC